MSENHEKKIIEKFASDVGIIFPEGLTLNDVSGIFEKIGFEYLSVRDYSAYTTKLNERLKPNRILPIARSTVSDDTLGLSFDDENHVTSVVVFHDFTSPGWENLVKFNSISELLEKNDWY